MEYIYNCTERVCQITDTQLQIDQPRPSALLCRGANLEYNSEVNTQGFQKRITLTMYRQKVSPIRSILYASGGKVEGVSFYPIREYITTPPVRWFVYTGHRVKF